MIPMTKQDEIKELKEKIAKIEEVKDKGFFGGMALDSSRKKLQKLEKDGSQK